MPTTVLRDPQIFRPCNGPAYTYILYYIISGTYVKTKATGLLGTSKHIDTRIGNLILCTQSQGILDTRFIFIVIHLVEICFYIVSVETQS